MVCEIRASTFNGNVVIGIGDTKKAALVAAQSAANSLGSCIKRVISASELGPVGPAS